MNRERDRRKMHRQTNLKPYNLLLLLPCAAEGSIGLVLCVLQYTPLNATSPNTKAGQTKTADQACQYKNF